MNNGTALDIPPIIKGPVVDRSFLESLRSAGRLFWKVAVFFWKYVVGMVFCQFFLGAILIVGWTYRLMQRFVYRRWWERSEARRSGKSFREFLAEDESTRAHFRWPNWFVAQNFREAVRRRPLRSLVSSLWANLRTGAQGIFNTWVLTMPGCLLMLFSWYHGWNNSFNKGYEQAAVGPLTGLLGLILFILAMLYVPMAQTRQAATGEWKSFYDFRLVRKLVLRRWPACLGLAILLFAFLLANHDFANGAAVFPPDGKAISEVHRHAFPKGIARCIERLFLVWLRSCSCIRDSAAHIRPDLRDGFARRD